MSIPTDHTFAFDPTYGMGLDQLRAIRPPPATPRFEAFWRARHERALGVTPQPRLGESGASHPNWHVHDIVYTSTDAFPIGGWLLLPRDGMVRRGLVVGHGYGGRDQPDFDIPVTETAVLFPCFRGLSRSKRPPISSDPTWHVLHDIDKPDRYILGGCVEDLWVAVSVLTTLYPWLDGRIGYSGISFGGGIGALAIPGVGPLIAAGPIMGALAGLGVGGAVGGVVGALVGMGIPEYEAKRYEGAVKDGGTLLSVHCDTSDQISVAKDALRDTGAHDVSSTSEAGTEDARQDDLDDRDRRQEETLVGSRTESRF